jgi:hypothetical protein
MPGKKNKNRKENENKNSAKNSTNHDEINTSSVTFRGKTVFYKGSEVSNKAYVLRMLSREPHLQSTRINKKYASFTHPDLDSRRFGLVGKTSVVNYVMTSQSLNPVGNNNSQFIFIFSPSNPQYTYVYYNSTNTLTKMSPQTKLGPNSRFRVLGASLLFSLTQQNSSVLGRLTVGQINSDNITDTSKMPLTQAQLLQQDPKAITINLNELNGRDLRACLKLDSLMALQYANSSDNILTSGNRPSIVVIADFLSLNTITTYNPEGLLHHHLSDIHNGVRVPNKLLIPLTLTNGNVNLDMLRYSWNSTELPKMANGEDFPKVGAEVTFNSITMSTCIEYEVDISNNVIGQSQILQQSRPDHITMNLISYLNKHPYTLITKAKGSLLGTGKSK